MRNPFHVTYFGGRVLQSVSGCGGSLAPVANAAGEPGAGRGTGRAQEDFSGGLRVGVSPSAGGNRTRSQLKGGSLPGRGDARLGPGAGRAALAPAGRSPCAMAMDSKRCSSRSRQLRSVECRL